jgi:Cft2 family RNA processing exonuclease
MNHSESQLERVKQNVQTAINLLPDQFALQEVKTNLRKTLMSINEVEEKRIKRKQNDTANERFVGFTSMEDAKKALDILDKMMKEEEKILQNAEDQKIKSNQKTTGGLFLG